MKSFFSKAGANNAPESVTATPFTATSSVAIPMTPLSSGKHVVYFTPTQNCYVRFGTSSVGAATSSHWRLIANKRVRMVVSNDSNHFRVIRASSDGLLYWYVSGESAAETPAQILGSNLIDEWDSEVTADATAWTSINGRDVTAEGTPTYGADGSLFGLHNVVGSLIAGPDYMQSGDLTGLPAAGSTPYVYAVGRCSALGGIQVWGGFGTAATTMVRFFQFSSNLSAAYGSTSITLEAESTAIKFLECWSDGTRVYAAVNGATTSTAAVETLSGNTVRLAVGNKTEADDGPFAGLHARWGICTTAPTDAQRARLLNSFRRVYGF